jgi:hypothetical protein
MKKKEVIFRNDEQAVFLSKIPLEMNDHNWMDNEWLFSFISILNSEEFRITKRISSRTAVNIALVMFNLHREGSRRAVTDQKGSSFEALDIFYAQVSVKPGTANFRPSGSEQPGSH